MAGSVSWDGRDDPALPGWGGDSWGSKTHGPTRSVVRMLCRGILPPGRNGVSVGWKLVSKAEWGQVVPGPRFPGTSPEG